MSKYLFKKAYDGAVVAISRAQMLLNQAILEFGQDKIISYPNTNYKLPVITALSGEDVRTLKDLVAILNRLRYENVLEVLTLDGAKANGEAALYSAEIIEVLRFIIRDNAYHEAWTGFLPDTLLSKFGIQLVDFTIPGVAVILGKAKDSRVAAKLIKDLQSKGILIMLCDEIIEQLILENVNIGIDCITLPIGNVTSIIHTFNFALRGGLAFGGIAPGNKSAHLEYQKNRVRAFVLDLGEADELRIALGFGAIMLGVPVITDQTLEEEVPDWYVHQPDYDKIVQEALFLRGIKLKIVEIPVPIAVGTAFEGEIIRENDTYVEFGGGREPSFELVTMVTACEIQDEKITLIGPEINEILEGSLLSLGIYIKVYGRKMHKDFEGALERRIHNFINYGEGLWHMAQRDMCSVRISKQAKDKGFLFKHFGQILIAKFKSEFPSIIDRVEVILYTEKGHVLEKLKIAKKFYAKRDERLRGLTDNVVQQFFSCTMCQSIAPNHVCVVTPERVGLCGAVGWLDAKASFEINPTGPNKPIYKEGSMDEDKGIWKSVNDFVYLTSNRTVESVALYTIMDSPMTSSGCFEAIMAIVPEANGFMIGSREYFGTTTYAMARSDMDLSDMTSCYMKPSDMALSDMTSCYMKPSDMTISDMTSCYMKPSDIKISDATACDVTISGMVPFVMKSSDTASSDMTPCGMTFSNLVATVSRGVQTPGFMGIGRNHIISKKFIIKDGGLARIIWMTKDLKEGLRVGLIKRSVELGLGEDFIEKIADESIGNSIEEIITFLKKKGHPALDMEPLL